MSNESKRKRQAAGYRAAAAECERAGFSVVAQVNSEMAALLDPEWKEPELAMPEPTPEPEPVKESRDRDAIRARNASKPALVSAGAKVTPIRKPRLPVSHSHSPPVRKLA